MERMGCVRQPSRLIPTPIFANAKIFMDHLGSCSLFLLAPAVRSRNLMENNTRKTRFPATFGKLAPCEIG